MAKQKAAKASEITEEYPLAHYLEKSISATAERCIEWISDQTGYDDLDPKSVSLTMALYPQFQRSDFNQEALKEIRAADKAAKAAAAAAPKPVKVAKAKKGKAAAAPEAVEDGAEAKPSAKGRKARRHPAASKRAVKDDTSFSDGEGESVEPSEF